MENTAPATPEVQAPAATAPSAEISGDNIEMPSFEKGGKLLDDLRWVNIITSAVLISASLYAIYYFKKSIVKMKEEEEEDYDELYGEVQEVKTNLKRLMGKKYVANS
jgi:hypothetical protein